MNDYELSGWNVLHGVCYKNIQKGKGT